MEPYRIETTAPTLAVSYLASPELRTTGRFYGGRLPHLSQLSYTIGPVIGSFVVVYLGVAP